MKYIYDTKIGKSVSAYVVLNKKGDCVATIRAIWTDGGTCLVNVHDAKGGFQHAKRGGGGYDKFTSALSGMTIDGHKLNGHCGMSQPLPRGKKLFPVNYKHKKGYKLANYCELDRLTGKRLSSSDFNKQARENLNIPAGLQDLNDSDFTALCKEAQKLFREWQESADCLRGYTSCFRDSGLDYLTAIGYKVIRAI